MDVFLRQFDINFVGLKPGVHHFHYQIDHTFFEHFEGSLIQEAAIGIELRFDKKTSFFQLDFSMSGTVKFPCNRCNTVRDFPIDVDFPMVVKMDDRIAGDDENDADDAVWFISRNESSLNVAQLIYEYVNLSTPEYKAVCERVGKKCDPEMLKKLKEYAPGPETETTADSQWEQLKKIKIK